MAKGPYVMSKRAREFLLALSGALVAEPEDLLIHDRDEALLGRCQIMMREFPRFSRAGFLFLLFLFNNIFPLCFGFGLRRFTRMDLSARRECADRWLASSSHVVKEAFKALRGFVMVAYFSHPDVWAYIGYDPKKHVAERIRLREELIARDARNAAMRKEGTTDLPRPENPSGSGRP